MAKRKYRILPPETKAKLLKEHLVDGRPVSDLCDENNLHPSAIYGWQNQLFERAPAVLASDGKRVGSRERELEEENARLRAKLQEKDNVIAEVAAELVKTKKELGEP